MRKGLRSRDTSLPCVRAAHLEAGHIPCSRGRYIPIPGNHGLRTARCAPALFCRDSRSQAETMTLVSTGWQPIGLETQPCPEKESSVPCMFKWLFGRLERMVDWAARREVRKQDERRDR